MKTQIITLEAHDDLISVRDRMSWAKSPRILLVWPRFEEVALRPVDLRVLQQHAQYLGADLGLVTRRGDVRRQAQSFDIPVFRSSVDAQRGGWPPHAGKSRRGRRATNKLAELRETREALHAQPSDWSARPLGRIAAFSLGVLAVLVMAALFVPRATIRLTPETSRQSISMPIVAGPSNVSVSLTGAVPAHVTSVIVDGTQSAKITSQAKIPELKAKGIARIQNLTQQAVVIPAGTVLYSASPVSARFATVNEVQLEGKLNAFVEVPIQALQAGAVGNIPANSITAIEGSLGPSLSATNPEPTEGGSDRAATVPSDEDRNHLREALLENLTGSATTKLQNAMVARDILLANTVHAAETEEETYDPVPGQPGSLLTLTMRVKFEAQYVQSEDLQRLAETSLNASLASGFRPVASTLSFTLAGVPTSDKNGDSSFNLDMQRTIVREVDVQRAGVLVRGLSPEAAGRVLQSNFPLTDPPEITLSPSWWPWLPLIPFRIVMSLP